MTKQRADIGILFGDDEYSTSPRGQDAGTDVCDYDGIPAATVREICG
ncbi:MAG TPA: hypothetical protein VHX38_40360 [Pseudonocardiaceae bacterium]|jgi:hypothetical protein|nr:hypothetical protein [Pseudonocardiaceae bacterium]